MSSLLAIYLLVCVLCGIDSIVERKIEVGPLQFLPPPAVDFPVAGQGVCVACNHSNSSAQCTMHLFVDSREKLSSV
jgi:hypothetical protein